MKKLMHRIATAAAAVAVTGGALVAVGGPASAAALPADRHNDPSAVVRVATERSDQSLSRTGAPRFEHRLGENGEQYPLWDGRRDWYHEQDQRGHEYWHSSDHSRQLRYDGHRVYHWIDGRWAIVTPANELEYGFDRWHFDQLSDSYSAANSRGV
ncbi:hypothetical protein [Streptomyces sp. NPDC001820]|uniref:hypothetical protein n=1 Tax=Streptomyces sp. NPDC001820 TaxID=3364613 RepID=UPI00369BBBA1